VGTGILESEAKLQSSEVYAKKARICVDVEQALGEKGIQWVVNVHGRHRSTRDRIVDTKPVNSRERSVNRT